MLKELSVSEWKQEIANGLEYRKLYGIESSWAELEALFYNVHQSSESGPNIIASTGDALLSTLAIANPYIMVKATSAGSMLKARMIESIDNELVEELALRREVEQALLHAFIYGVGHVKIGYDSEWGWDQDPEGLGISLSQFDRRGRRIEFDSRVSPGMPWVRAVLPHDIVVPFGATDVDDAPWIAHRFVRHVDDLKSDPKYRNTKDLVPNMSMDDYMKSYLAVVKPYRMGDDEIGSGVSNRSGSETKNSEFCEGWEIHDKRTGMVYVIVTGYDKFIRKTPDLLQVNGQLPFVRIALVPSSRSYWVTPDAYYLRYSQAELSDIALQTAKQRRVSIIKFLYNEDAIEEDELEKVLSADVAAAVKVNGGFDLNQSITTMTPGNLNSMLYQDAEYIRRDAREVVGFSRNQLGEYDTSSRRTAREAMLVQQGASTRVSRRQIVLAAFYQDIMKQVNSIVFTYWATPRFVQLGGEQWVPYVGTDLKGRYNYRITFSSEPHESLDGRVGRAMGLFQALANDPTVDQMALKQLLIESLNDPEIRNVFANMSGGSANAGVPAQMSPMQATSGRVQTPQALPSPP